ncbi:MAG: hypothetical protein HQK78_14585 [Desulfobacterales bacterium]|nr:hypothetical protein [Desulfobacterales bacterium]
MKKLASGYIIGVIVIILFISIIIIYNQGNSVSHFISKYATIVHSKLKPSEASAFTGTARCFVDESNVFIKKNNCCRKCVEAYSTPEQYNLNVACQSGCKLFYDEVINSAN